MLDTEIDPATASGELLSEARRETDLRWWLGAGAERHLAAARTQAQPRAELSDLRPKRPVERVVPVGRARAPVSPGGRAGHGRSEERRVGKECRFRWSPAQIKKK